MNSDSQNNLSDNAGALAPGYPLRDLNGRFVDQHNLKVIRARNGRYMGNLCNCCKTNKIPKGKYYCNFCKEFIQAINCKYKERNYRLEYKVTKFKTLLGSNPGNVLQMLGSYKKYKSSSFHYKNKFEETLEELIRLKMQQGLPVGQRV